MAAFVDYAVPAFSSAGKKTSSQFTNAGLFLNKSRPSQFYRNFWWLLIFEIWLPKLRGTLDVCLSGALAFNIFEFHLDNIDRERSPACFAGVDGVQVAIQNVLPNDDESNG